MPKMAKIACLFYDCIVSVLRLYYVCILSALQRLTKLTVIVRQRLRGLTKGFGMGDFGWKWLTLVGESVGERLTWLSGGEGDVRCVGLR